MQHKSWLSAGFAALFVSISSGAVVQTGGSNPFNAGGTVYSLYPGASALHAKTIDNSFYKPEWAPGQVLHNVNLLTGQPVYPVKIAEIQVVGGSFGFPITFTYNGSVRSIYDADNEKGPTSWIGYGWSFAAPFIAANTRGTSTISDDIYYCDLGPFGAGQFLAAPTASAPFVKYYLASNPAVSILPPVMQNGDISNWVLEFSGGMRLSFGSDSPDDNAVRYFNNVQNHQTGSPYTAASGVKSNYRWDLRKIEDGRTLQGTANGGLFFSYERFDVSLGAGGVAKFTSQSYLREIVSKNWHGDVIEKYRFVLGDKTPAEYGTSDFEPGMGQVLNETKYLDRIERYVEDGAVFDRQFKLNAGGVAAVEPAAFPAFPYPKRFLRNIQPEFRNPLGNLVSDPKAKWTFSYDGTRHFGISVIQKPGSGKEEFFYEKPVFMNTDWAPRSQQDGIIRKVRRVIGSTVENVVLPTDKTAMADNFESMAECTEKFCFMALLENNITSGTNGVQQLHLTVYKNNGNYFKLASVAGGTSTVMEKTFSSEYNKSLKLVPWNDNFFIVDGAAKTFILYEWDGEQFTARTNILKRNYQGGALVPMIPYPGPFTVAPTEERTQILSIVPGVDFFAVKDVGTVDCTNNGVWPNFSQVYVVKKINGQWKDINEGTCTITNRSTCPMHQSDLDMGEGRSCMEFFGNPSVYANNNILNTINHHNKVLDTWVEKIDGTGFIRSLLWHGVGPLAQPIVYGKDYFGLVDMLSPTAGRILILHFDGSQARIMLNQSNNTTRWANIHPGPDYFVVSDIAGGVATATLYKKTVQKTGSVPTGFTFTSYPVFSQSISPLQVTPVLKTHPSAFSIDIYEDKHIKNGRPIGPPLSVDGDYLSRLYEVDPALTPNPFREVGGSFLDSRGNRFFDITFAGADNMLFGKSCRNASETRCVGAENEAARIYFVSALMRPRVGAVNQFLTYPSEIYDPWPFPADHLYKNFDISPASRMAVRWNLNNTTHNAEYTLLQSMGDGFTLKPYSATGGGTADYNYVKSFRTSSDITGTGLSHFTDYAFRYTPDPSHWNLVDGMPEFNSHLRSFIFPSAGVITYKGSANQTTALAHASETVHHIVDQQDNQLEEGQMIRQGLVIKSRLHVAMGAPFSLGRQISRTDNEYSDSYRDASWPDKLFITKPKSVKTTEWARGGTFQIKTRTYHRYNPINHQMAFAKYKLGAKWYLEQTLFQPDGANKGLPIGNVKYRFATEPADADLEAWNRLDLAYSTGGAEQNIIAASQKEFDPAYPYMEKKGKAWKFTDAGLTDADLKKGKDPVRNNSGWVDLAVSEKFNAFGQPRSMKTVLSESQKLENPAALFYEGRRSLLVGKVENAYHEDAAVLTAENGNMSFATHDWSDDARWKKADNGYSSKFSHTGRWSIFVVDNYGPNIDLKLKGVSAQGYGYVVSAWIYSEGAGSTSVMSAQVIKAGTTTSAASKTVLAPVDEAYAAKKWQRYEIRFTNSELRTSQNLFATENSNDFLRVRIGTGNPGVSFSRAVYVDDIVCRPTTAQATLMAYDERGNVVQRTDNDFKVATIEYDIFGNQTAVKDDEFRMLSTSSTHLPGDDD